MSLLEPLVDREVERAQLADLLRKPGPRLAVLYGRRRVGKTFLLNHAWEGAQRFYFLCADRTPELNREDLLAEISRWSGEPFDPADYPTWRTVFRLLLELRSPEPLAVVLDEFQYLAGGGDGILSQLVAVWDLAKDRRPFVLVLCGSAIRAMDDLDHAESPLYGRLDWKCQVQPFDYWHAGQLTAFPDLRDRARAYGIYGGTPRYLATLDLSRPLAENASAAVLSPNGSVRHLVDTAIDQEKGLRSITEYKAIVEAIGRGRTGIGEIASLTGLPVGTPLRQMLRRLVDLGYVEEHRNFAAGPKEAFRYRLLDPAMRFHHGVVLPLRSALETADPLEVWRDYVAGQLDAYMGHVFEDIARQAYLRLRAACGLPILRTWGRWEGLDRQRRPLEVDIVAQALDGRMLTGSIKWVNRPVGAALHAEHVRMLQRLADSGHRWAHRALEPDSPFVYVSAGGFTADFRPRAEADGHPVVTWTLNDLYSAAADGARNYA